LEFPPAEEVVQGILAISHMFQLYRPVGHAEVDKIPPHDFGVGRVVFDKENNNGFSNHGVSLPFFDGLLCQFPPTCSSRIFIHR
jgi:hypothetical protein